VKTARERLVVLKNAFANVVRGSASALVALLLPPFLTRSMSEDAYGAWALVLQLSAYVGYLDFGIQTAVGRFVAHANERGDPEYRDKIVSTSLAILTVSGVLAWTGALAVAVLMPELFHKLPADLVHDVRVATILVAGSMAVGLPASVYNGIFVGLQRNEIPAVIIGASRLTGAALVLVIVRRGGSLAQLGAATAIVNLCSYLLQYLMYRRIAPDMRLSPRLISKPAAFELIDYCLSMTVWSAALLLVTGLDLTIVGIYRFREVAYYAIAATIVTFIGGLYSALFSPMIPVAAIMHARGDAVGLGRMVLVTTRYGILLLLFTGLPLVFGAVPILKLWVGPVYALNARVLVQVLVTANIIRLSVTPYVVAMIGSGEQRLVILTPILEGITNLIVSMIAGYYLGALGVAIGTLVGAFVGAGGNLLYNMRRTVAIRFSVTEYALNSLLRPLVCALPVLGFALFCYAAPALWLFARPLVAGMVLLSTIALCWFFGLMPEERRGLKAQLNLRKALNG
jgi:O-antigen/teichoic acid export membrane protein